MGTRRDLRRRIEQFVANPRCEANVLSVVADVSLRAVAATELPPDHPALREAQSPFALARGVTFEKSLYLDTSAFLAELARADVIAAQHGGAIDLRLRAHGGPMADLDASAEAFAAVLRGLARTGVDVPRDEVPALVIAPAMKLPGAPLLPYGVFAADLVAIELARDAPRIRLRVGEVKVYPDRGGHTDRAQLASARAQAGLYVHALRRTIDALGLTRDLAVDDRGFLVLARPTSNRPSIRWPEDLRWQARRAEDWWTRLSAVASTHLAQGPVEDPVARVTRADTRYEESCASFCARAPVCRARAVAAGDPVVLGGEVATLLGGVTLLRADALLRRNEPPTTPAEEDLLRRLARLDDVKECCR